MPNFRGITILTILNVVFFCTAQIRLSGIRKVDLNDTDSYEDVDPYYLEMEPDKEFNFRLFGNNLPKEGFFFTTATRCQDLYNHKESTVFVDLSVHQCRYADFHVPTGLPFNTSNTIYHLCHLNATTPSEDLLSVHKKDKPREYSFNSNDIVLCILCIACSAYAAGMTLGYMKFSIVELNTMINTGDKSLVKRAQRILQFRRRSNYLVVAFSLFSSVFSVFFTTIIEKMLAGVPNEEVLEILIPALVLLIFAELIPQSICNSKLGFNLASGLWFVTVLVFVITFPVAYPISLVLGRFLKRDVREVLTQEEKTCMIRNLAKNANEREKTILENATTFATKRVGELMVPITEVFMLSRSQKLNRSTILTLVEKGYTRIPIYEDKNKNAIIGVLNMKDLNLVTCDLSKEPTVREVLRQLENLKEEKKRVKFAAKYVNIDMNAQLLLNQMRTGDFHFACVVKYRKYDSKVVGIITIEDILEELFGKIDENNERRVRSSVDERADNSVIGWCREAGSDEIYPLTFSQQLRVLQHLLRECKVFRNLDIGILKAKQLLTLDRCRLVRKDEDLPLEELFLVIWKGTVKVENQLMEQYVQEVKVPSKKSMMIVEMPLEHHRASVPALIVGKPLLVKLIKSLGSPFNEPLSPKDYFTKVTAVSDEVHFFKLRLKDLLNAINGCPIVKKNETRIPGDSLIQRFSRQNTPVSRTPKSVESTEQTMHLLGNVRHFES